MNFHNLSHTAALKALGWREKVPQACRTPYDISDVQQHDWWKSLQTSKVMRFWEAELNSQLVAVFGLTHIEHENGRAQISLIVGTPNKGYGKQCLEFLFDMAFNRMRLRSLYAECYMCNPNIEFWRRQAKRYNAAQTSLPLTKFWNGEHYDSLFLTFDRDAWKPNPAAEGGAEHLPSSQSLGARGTEDDE